MSTLHHRPPARSRARLLVGVAVAFGIANGLACLDLGRRDVPVRPGKFGAISARAETVGRVFRFLIVNTITASGLAYVVLARQLEDLRRRRLNLPRDEDGKQALYAPAGGRPLGQRCRAP